MNHFDEAFDKTMSHEGGYSDDPTDAGGETYKGISRVYNPNWSGWVIIDSLKSTAGFPQQLGSNAELQACVRGLYKQKYFEPYQGDRLPELLAIEMFDTSVNMGVGRAVKFLQIALNVLNRNEKLYPDMVEDGDYGNTTHSNLYTYLQKNDIGVLLKIMNVLQGMHYINYMKKSPKQEKYARGWFNRVTFDK